MCEIIGHSQRGSWLAIKIIFFFYLATKLATIPYSAVCNKLNKLKLISPFVKISGPSYIVFFGNV